MVYQKTKYTLKIRNRSLHIPDMSSGKRSAKIMASLPNIRNNKKRKEKIIHSFVHSRRLALLVAKILIIM